MTFRAPHVLAGLRFRIVLLVMAGVLLAGAVFQSLLVVLTRTWLADELDFRTRSVAMALADRVVTPIVVHDTLGVHEKITAAAATTDLVSIEVTDLRGAPRGRIVGDPGRWRPATPEQFAGGARERTHVWASHGAHVHEIVVAVVRNASGSWDDDETFPVGPAPVHRQQVGWVRVLTSTERLDAAVATASQLGLLLLLGALGVVLIGTAWFVAWVVRPLREASQLARQVAAGRFERTLPVRSDDEVGTLARSLNQMADAVRAAREHAQDEAQALRAASAAVVAVAREARTADGPRAMFGVVATQARRVCGCESVTLAMADPEGVVRVSRSEADGAEPLPEGLAFDGTLAACMASDITALRFVPSGVSGTVAERLAASGFAAALAVPLPLPGGPPAVLLLASRRPDAFPTSEAEVVTALASHLSSSLHAQQLHGRLEQAFAELQRTHDYLVQSEMLRVAGEMAAGVAHEFNNVLGAILGRAQLLRRRAGGGAVPADELSAGLEVIERAARDGAETGRRLRQFGRGGVHPGREPVALARAVRDAVEFTRPRWENQANAAGLRIDMAFDLDDGVWVLGHAHEMREVFTNLLLNAVDAMPRGGTITLRVRAEDRMAVALVEDDGEGMDEETRHRMFEPFFSTKGEHGTGLGLSVVYGIVQRQGGTLEVTSARQEGTCITVRLPLARAPVIETAAPDLAPTTPLRVVVVDDDGAVRSVIHDMLELMGHTVSAYDSGEAALAAWSPAACDLLLTDLGMPGMTGWQLAEQLRSMEPELAIAFVTGWGGDVTPEAARAAGADDVLAKPFTMDDVASVCARAAARRGMNRAA